MKENAKKILLNPFWILYSLLVLAYLSAPYFMGDIWSIPRDFVLLWGGILSIYFLIFKRKAFFNLPTLFMLLFVIATFITILLNYKSMLLANSISWAYMILGGILLFNNNYEKSQVQVEKEQNQIMMVNVFFSFLFAVAAFVMLFEGITIEVVTDGIVRHYGVYENRLWGIINANTAGQYCVLSIFSSLFLILRHKWNRWIWIINIIMQFSYLVLTQSRGAWVAFIVSLFLIVPFVFIGWNKISSVNWKKRITYAGVFALILISVFLCKQLVKSGAEFYGEVLCIDADSQFDTVRTDLGNEVSNGRIAIWKAGIELWKEQPLMGTGIYNIETYAQNNAAEKVVEKLSRGGLHNFYLTVLVSNGIVGFVLMATFLIILGLRFLNSLFHCENKSNLIFGIMFSAILIVNLVETNIVYWKIVQSMLFWCACSYLNWNSVKRKKA